MPRRTELQLQKKIVAHIIERGGRARILWQNAHTIVGDPDIYGCYRGRALQLEVKEEGEKPSAIQRRRIAEWRRSGAVAAVVYSVEEVTKILRRIDTAFYDAVIRNAKR